MAKSKPAAKKTAKKPAAKKTAKPKLPFYAQLLTSQESKRLQATNKDNDSLKTDKYPNDEADVIFQKEAGQAYSFGAAATSKKADQVVITLKYPSDNDEDITLKYPSDGDDAIVNLGQAKEAGLRTTRYPNDEYAQAIDVVRTYKRDKAIAQVKPTRPINDVVQTLKYPSDNDESTPTTDNWEL